MIRGLLAIATLLAACGKPEAPTAHADDLGAVPADAPRGAREAIAGAHELITGIAVDWDATKVVLHRYRREGKKWNEVGKPWGGVVGRAGLAWGSGLHGDGAPGGEGGPIKREGDGKSPAGAFAIGHSYGYASAPPRGARLAYTPVDDAWKCVDDPASRSYNRVLDQRTATVDWKSAEDMHRSDALYTWVVDVGHNLKRTPQGGSCIFLHVWSGPDSATVGCTAMAEPVLADLIATMDPSTVFVLLPDPAYSRLAMAWGIPRF